MGSGKSKKWKLWRTSSSGASTTSLNGTTTKVAGRLSDSSYTAAMAKVLRAPARDFLIVRQEWAAIRIQTVFRAFLVIFLFPFIYFFVIHCLHVIEYARWLINLVILYYYYKTLVN